MTFGMKLQELRLGRGWTQKELAEHAGLAQSQIARWEAGKRIPGLDEVHAICKALGMKLRVFEDCQPGLAEEKRGRGRPKKS